MSSLYILEPSAVDAAWFPFASAQPLSDIRVGAWPQWQRWQRAVNATKVQLIETVPHLTPGAPEQVSASTVSGPAWVVDATFAPKLPMRAPGAAKRLLHEGRAVAWRLDAGQKWDGPFASGDGVVIEGRALKGAHDIITALEQYLFSDTLLAMEEPHERIPDGCIVLGNAEAVANRGAVIEPGVVFDVRKGAIVLERGAEVRSGSRLEGPLWIGAGTFVLGGFLRHVSAGPHCRLHGEISTSVFFGYANKSHDGFIGHSVIGEWVNLGAGTITSNLKNTYGPIRLESSSSARVETGRTNLGTMFGPHAKTAIGTLMPTGALVGAGANLFGAPRAPKYTSPFSWGDDATVDVNAFVDAAKRVLPRRDVTVTPQLEQQLRQFHQRLAAPRE